MVCIVKTNKNGVRGSQASKSPAVRPPDPNLLAEPREADKPRWLQTVGSKKGNNASSRAAAPEQEGRRGREALVENGGPRLGPEGTADKSHLNRMGKGSWLHEISIPWRSDALNVSERKGRKGVGRTGL